MEIKLTDKDKKQLTNPDDVYDIMQRILLRDNKIDREKEHFWIIGMNLAGYILYIELVSLGSVSATVIEPMNVYRIAVMKNAPRVVAIHNHPSGNVTPSACDKDITDRLIQVGRILNISLDDHLVISTKEYLSFRRAGLMTELEASLKYVPTYQIIEQIRKQEQAIAKERVRTAKEAESIAKLAALQLKRQLKEKETSIRSAKEEVKIAREETRTEREQRERSEQILLAAIHFLQQNQHSSVEIAEILQISSAEVEKLLGS
ncbi:JAB domain-containing protein [Serratia microhaemolytica]|uniref:JAB domain-containing protein n=1 Tax=Serratia microhaemolytica TaxID=2675110 RepID=UPI000FDD9EB6|nr:JAB domain-containing protein [Serratia microhaemolytica]